MSLARAAILGAGANWMGAAVGFVVRFALTAILSRLIGPEIFGEYALAFVYSELLSIIIAASFAQSIVQFDDELELLIAGTIQLNAVVCALLIVASLCLYPFAVHSDGYKVGAVVVGLGLARALVILASTYEMILQRELRFTKMASVRVIGVAVSMSVALVLALAHWPFGALFVRDTLPVIGATWGMLRHVPINWKLVFRPTAELRQVRTRIFKLGASIFWVRALDILYQRIDQLLLGRLLGPADLGYYSQARYVGGLPQAAIIHATSSVSLKVLASVVNDPPRFRRAGELMQLGVAHLLALCGVVLTAAPYVLVRTAFGERWTPVAVIAPWTVGWIVMIPLASTAQTALMTLGGWSALRRAQFIQLVALIVSASVLVPILGPRGAALAITIAVGVGLFMMRLAMAPEYRNSFSIYRGLVVGALSVGALLWWRRPSISPPAPAHEIVSAVLAVLVYVIGALAADHRRIREMTTFLIRQIRSRTGAAPTGV